MRPGGRAIGWFRTMEERTQEDRALRERLSRDLFPGRLPDESGERVGVSLLMSVGTVAVLTTCVLTWILRSSGPEPEGVALPLPSTPSAASDSPVPEVPTLPPLPTPEPTWTGWPKVPDVPTPRQIALESPRPSRSPSPSPRASVTESPTPTASGPGMVTPATQTPTPSSSKPSSATPSPSSSPPMGPKPTVELAGLDTTSGRVVVHDGRGGVLYDGSLAPGEHVRFDDEVVTVHLFDRTSVQVWANGLLRPVTTSPGDATFTVRRMPSRGVGGMIAARTP